MAKPCRYCGMNGHTATFCYARPKNRALPSKTIKKIGKQGQNWLRTRADWFKQNEADHYTCYLCGERLTAKETTLDHVIPRSRRPDLRYDFTNLKPCCFRCNKEKGSKVY